MGSMDGKMAKKFAAAIAAASPAAGLDVAHAAVSAEVQEESKAAAAKRQVREELLAKFLMGDKDALKGKEFKITRALAESIQHDKNVSEKKLKESLRPVVKQFTDGMEILSTLIDAAQAHELPQADRTDIEKALSALQEMRGSGQFNDEQISSDGDHTSDELQNYDVQTVARLKHYVEALVKFQMFPRGAQLQAIVEGFAVDKRKDASRIDLAKNTEPEQI